ncbi:MAG: hypothetical protein ACLFVJ_13600 [Persicimonas sp.]
MHSSQSSSVLRFAGAVVTLCLLIAGCGEEPENVPVDAEEGFAGAADFDVFYISDDEGYVVYSPRAEDGHEPWRELYLLETDTGSRHRLGESYPQDDHQFQGPYDVFFQAPQDERLFYLVGGNEDYALEVWSPDWKETLAEGIRSAEYMPRHGVILTTRGDGLGYRDWSSFDTTTGEETPIATRARLAVEGPRGRYFLFETNSSGNSRLILWDAEDNEATTLDDAPAFSHAQLGFVVGDEGVTHIWFERRADDGPSDSSWTLPGQLWVYELSNGEKTLLDDNLLTVRTRGSRRDRPQHLGRIFWMTVPEAPPEASESRSTVLKSWDGRSETVRVLSENFPDPGADYLLRLSDDERLAVFGVEPDYGSELRLAAYDFEADETSVIADDAIRNSVRMLSGVPAVRYETAYGTQSYPRNSTHLWHANFSASTTLAHHALSDDYWLGTSLESNTGAFLTRREEDEVFDLNFVDFSDLSVEPFGQLPDPPVQYHPDWLAPDGNRLLYASVDGNSPMSRLWYVDRHADEPTELGEFEANSVYSSMRYDRDLARGFVTGDVPWNPSPIFAWSDGVRVGPADDALVSHVTPTDDWEHLFFIASDEADATAGELSRFSFGTNQATTLAEGVSQEAHRVVSTFELSKNADLLAYLGEADGGSCAERCAEGTSCLSQCTRPLLALDRPHAEEPTSPQLVDESAYRVLSVGEDWVLWVSASSGEGNQNGSQDHLRHLRFAKIR